MLLEGDLFDSLENVGIEIESFTGMNVCCCLSAVVGQIGGKKTSSEYVRL